MNKKKKVKVSKYENSDTKEIKSLIIITFVVFAIAGLLYILTNYINGKKEVSDTKIDYNTCLVGTMFNRPYDEYYVFIYNSKDSNASTYNGLITNYNEKEEHLKLYFLDLNEKLNESVISDTSNKNPSNSSEVKVKDSALILIKDGRVSKYYETLDEYKSALGIK